MLSPMSGLVAEEVQSGGWEGLAKRLAKLMIELRNGDRWRGLRAAAMAAVVEPEDGSGYSDDGTED